MVADILEDGGWDVRYLGADIPETELLKLIDEVKPAFIALSITMAFNVEKVVSIIKAIRSSEQNNNLKIMVGGIVINEEAELKHLLNADAYPYNAQESLEIANKWWDENNSKKISNSLII